MSQAMLHSCFSLPTSENAQAPIFPHFLNRAQPLAEPAGQMGALRGCVCMYFLACVCVLLLAWAWCILGVRGACSLGFKFCSIHAGPS